MQEQVCAVNGLQVYSLTNPNLKGFCLSLYVRAGSLFECENESGISHLFEHIVFRNIKAKYKRFYEQLALHGLQFQASTYKEFIRFYITGPHHGFAFAADILCHIFDEINIDSLAFEQEKKRIKAEIRESDEKSSLDFFFNKIVWGGTQLERTILGSCKVLDNLSRKKVNLFREKVLSAGNCFVYVTGNAGQDGLAILQEKLAGIHLNQTPTDFTNTVDVNEHFGNRDSKVHIKNDYWHYVKIGFDIDNTVCTETIADFLHSVLFEDEKALVYNYLSEDNPIIYSYSSAIEQYDNAGNLSFWFEVQESKMEEALRLIVTLLNDLKNGNFAFDANLQSVLCYTETEADNPSNQNWTLAYYNHILSAHPIDYDAPLFGRYDFTKEQVVEAAKKVFTTQNMTVAVKAKKKKVNAETLEEILKGLDG
ncbi:MAG: insulinase family protein [Clostridia bacterium]|nr:insulinase family protein [Clostridia bacterium]